MGRRNACSAHVSVRTFLSPWYRATYRARVVHGRQSINWANSVLPVFMVASGQKAKRLPELAISVQIDTSLNRPEIRFSLCVQSVNHSFNRTVVKRHKISKTWAHSLKPSGFRATSALTARTTTSFEKHARHASHIPVEPPEPTNMRSRKESP